MADLIKSVGKLLSGDYVGFAGDAFNAYGKSRQNSGGEDSGDSGQQGFAMPRPRPVSQLTRGQPMRPVTLNPIQKLVEGSPAVKSSMRYLAEGGASNIDVMRILRENSPTYLRMTTRGGAPARLPPPTLRKKDK